MSDPVQLRTARPAPDCVVLFVLGEVDLVTAPELELAISRELAAAPARLVLDLSGVTFFGSLGLAALIRGTELAAAHEVRLVLVTNRFVRRTMELTTTEELFETYETLEAAVSAPSG